MNKWEVLAAMQAARFVIFSSELYENLPLTIIESFACGVPVIASRLGAMQEIGIEAHDYVGLRKIVRHNRVLARDFPGERLLQRREVRDLLDQLLRDRLFGQVGRDQPPRVQV
ncbi:glycosyltransferase, partial [Lacticaseibacillus rhamnosus]